jgi:hypothetical protein
MQTLGQILLRTKLNKRKVMEVLDGLVTDGTVKMHMVSGAPTGSLYERVKETA